MSVLEDLYWGFEKVLFVLLWIEIGGFMLYELVLWVMLYLWEWVMLFELVGLLGGFVLVGCGGECRVIALVNLSFGGRLYVILMLWVVIQYLMFGEDVLEYWYIQNVFCFVVEGEGVWMVVEGDLVFMCCGDFLL